PKRRSRSRSSSRVDSPRPGRVPRAHEPCPTAATRTPSLAHRNGPPTLWRAAPFEIRTPVHTQHSDVRASRENGPRFSRHTMYDPLTSNELPCSLCDLVAMIRDDLRTALGRALERAGLP